MRRSRRTSTCRETLIQRARSAKQGRAEVFRSPLLRAAGSHLALLDLNFGQGDVLEVVLVALVLERREADRADLADRLLRFELEVLFSAHALAFLAEDDLPLGVAELDLALQDREALGEVRLAIAEDRHARHEDV